MTEIFQQNIQLLRDRNPELHDILINHHAGSSFREIPTLSGYPTLLHCPDNNESPSYLHSPENPLQEAHDLISNLQFHGEDITILLGFGLGYLPLVMSDHMNGDHSIFMIEASIDILLMAFRLVDLSSILKNHKVNIFHTDQIHLIWNELEKNTLNILGGEVKKLVYPPCRNIFPENYEAIEERIEAFVTAQQENFFALEGHWEQMTENVLNNLSPMKDAESIDSLFNRTENLPVLVVAAGPSLDKNIRQVKELEDRLFIISVDTAFQPLIREGIIPDLVVSVDPSPGNLKKFEQIPKEMLERVPLVFTPYVYHKIPDKFPKPGFIFGMPNRLIQWALNLRDHVSELPYGFTVSHHAFYLARAMGADPIIFAGLDLAFAPDGDHARNSAIQWDIHSANIDLLTVPGIDGTPVQTFKGFSKMITIFEKEIHKTKARCIDATEGGALIRGTEVMPLREAAELYPSGELSNKTAAVYGLRRQNRPSNVEGVKDGLTWLIDQAVEVNQLAKKALVLLDPIIQNHDMTSMGLADLDVRIEKIQAIAYKTDNHQDFLEVIKDQMGKVMVDQYRLTHQIQRIKHKETALRMDLEKSYLFFRRIYRITVKILISGKPVLDRIQKKIKGNL